MDCAYCFPHLSQESFNPSTTGFSKFCAEFWPYSNPNTTFEDIQENRLECILQKVKSRRARTTHSNVITQVR